MLPKSILLLYAYNLQFIIPVSWALEAYKTAQPTACSYKVFTSSLSDKINNNDNMHYSSVAMYIKIHNTLSYSLIFLFNTHH